MPFSDDLFTRLAKSPFRQRFRLGRAEYDYVRTKGEGVLRQHAADFIAQHATATCCRCCLSKWHNIAPNQPLSDEQQAYVVVVLLQWIADQMQQSAMPARAAKASKKPDDDPQLALW